MPHRTSLAKTGLSHKDPIVSQAIICSFQKVLGSSKSKFEYQPQHDNCAIKQLDAITLMITIVSQLHDCAWCRHRKRRS